MTMGIPIVEKVVTRLVCKNVLGLAVLHKDKTLLVLTNVETGIVRQQNVRLVMTVTI